MKTVLLFSGQGSQYVGMLKDISEKYPFAKEQIEKADNILDNKLSDVYLNGPIEELKKTKNTQPSIFLHSAINFELVRGNIEFDAVAGHSVGEYAALYAAGVLSFEDALKLVAYRGKLMFEAGEEVPGTMFAVIGLADDKVEAVCNELNDEDANNICVTANFNSPGQVVISGSAEYIRENAGKFKEAGAKMVKELVVSGAFHSPLMMPAKNELQKAIEQANFHDAKVPIYSNVYAKPIIKAEEIKEALILQLTHPVKWSQSLVQMKEDAADNFIEIGPGKVLQGLVKRTIKGMPFSGLDTAEEIEKIKS